MFKLGLLLIGASLVAGCSLIEAEKPVNYYVLDAKPVAPKMLQKQTLVAVDAIQLPDYLDQPNLVLRDSSQKLHVAFYHSWAEDFASAIRRVMISELNQSDTTVRYVQRCDNCQKLSIALNHFYPTTEGEVILAGDYVFDNESEYSSDLNSEEHQVPSAFLIEASLSADGYEHAVKKMRLTLGQLAKQIVTSRSKVLPKTGTLEEDKTDIEQMLDSEVALTADVEKIAPSKGLVNNKPIRRINLKKR